MELLSQPIFCAPDRQLFLKKMGNLISPSLDILFIEINLDQFSDRFWQNQTILILDILFIEIRTWFSTWSVEICKITQFGRRQNNVEAVVVIFIFQIEGNRREFRRFLQNRLWVKWHFFHFLVLKLFTSLLWHRFTLNDLSSCWCFCPFSITSSVQMAQ